MKITKAFVVQSADPTWPKWACVSPDGATKWYDTQEQAKNYAAYVNDVAGRGVVHRYGGPRGVEQSNLGDNAAPCPECSATGQHYKTCSQSED